MAQDPCVFFCECLSDPITKCLGPHLRLYLAMSTCDAVHSKQMLISGVNGI